MKNKDVSQLVIIEMSENDRWDCLVGKRYKINNHEKNISQFGWDWLEKELVCQVGKKNKVV